MQRAGAQQIKRLPSREVARDDLYGDEERDRQAPTPAEVAQYEAALAAELLPAMGCTEPIALSYAASIAASRLGGFPDEMTAEVSANIVKNVKSVVVPNTGGLTGIEAAVIAGFAANAPDAKLEVLARITPEVRDEIGRLVKTKRVNVVPTKEPDVFFIRVTGKKNGKTVSVTIRASHTNVTRIVEDGVTVFEKKTRRTSSPPRKRPGRSRGSLRPPRRCRSRMSSRF